MNGLVNFDRHGQTMSSREIAELTQKPHDNVLKLIRSLVDGGIVKNTHPQNYVHPQNKQTYIEYHSDKRDSLVIVARLSPEFTAAVVDRWQVLEEGQPFVPKSFPEALRLAATLAEEVEQKRLQLAMAAPKVEYYDKVVERDTLIIASQISQKFKWSAKKLNTILEEYNVYNMSIKRARVFQQWFIDEGYGVMRQTELGYPQGMFYPAGEAWIIEKLTGEGLI